MNKNILLELLEARIPEQYAVAAAWQREVLNEVSARLQWMTLKPLTILEVGCATGDGMGMLKEQYPGAQFIAIDSSENMVDYVKQRMPEVKCLSSLATLLPLQDHSVDLLLANLVLPWCDDLTILVKEWRRVLKPDGLLMLTSLGPDTLRELHHLPLAFPHLMDMHTVGDLLTQSGFSAPVLDVDYFTVTYREPKKLWHELQVTGMVAGDVDAIELEKPEKGYALSYEIIFAHAFAPALNATHTMNEKGEVRIPISHILRR